MNLIDRVILARYWLIGAVVTVISGAQYFNVISLSGDDLALINLIASGSGLAMGVFHRYVSVWSASRSPGGLAAE